MSDGGSVPTPWAERLFAAMLRRRRLVLAALTAVSIAAAWSCAGLRFDASIEIWFLDDDPTLVSYHAFGDRFGADEVLVIGAFADDVFSPAALAVVHDVTEAVAEAPHVHRVRSLTRTRIARAPGGGMVRIGPLIDGLPDDAAAADEVRAAADEVRALRGVMYAEDYKATAIVVELDQEANDFDSKVALVDAVREVLARHDDGPVRWRMSGSPPLDEAFYRYSQRDFVVFLPVTFAVVLLSMVVAFRRLSATVIPLSVVALTNVWLFGLMAALDLPLNLVSSGLGALVLAVGVADSVHVISDYYAWLRRGLDPDEAVVKATATMLVPCLFTSLTTAAGMLSLLVSDLAPIREFGWLAAAGVMIAFFLSMTWIPCILRAAKPPDPAFVEATRRGLIARALGAVARPAPAASRRRLLIGVVLTALSVFGMTRLDVGANPMSYFHPGDPIRQHTEAIDAALGGSTTLEFLVQAGEQGLKEPANLARLDAFQRWLEGLEGVHRAFSVVDSLMELRRVFTSGEAEDYLLPDSRPLVAQLGLLIEGEDDFAAMVADDWSTGRISAQVGLASGQHLASELDSITARAAVVGEGSALVVEPTGFITLMSRMEAYLLDSQMRSFGAAFVFVSLLLIILLRSWRLGLFSLIPNVIPVAMGLGLMAAVGIPLDPGTVMIGSIALGLVVDDSVHFLVRLRREIAAQATLEDAVAATVTGAGRPIVLTSVVLACGFSVLVLGSFMPNIYFGAVSAAVVLFAMVCDLVLLPAALLVIRPRL